MKAQNLEELRYPIGKYHIPEIINDHQIVSWINTLQEIPQLLRDVVEPLNDEQLETPYRPNGWSVRQLVHHIADSHHHSYVRFKWALTEENPLIKPYNEKAWSELFDAKTAPISLSLDHLTAVHAKLVFLLKGLSKTDLERSFTHPAANQVSTLAENIGRYAWHGTHHLEHIKNLVSRSGW